MPSLENHPLWNDFRLWESFHQVTNSERFRLWTAFLAGAAAEEKRKKQESNVVEKE
jgi:hypothetical protein